jgi:spermidine synthase
LLPVLVLLSFGSGVAALIYEIVWFQMLELVIGSSAVSLGVLLATFMGGMCLGSLLLPRLIADRHRALRVYAAIELGIGALAILVLRLAPRVGGVYTSWSGYGMSGFLLRGLVAAVCLLPPTLLMGATLPALARAVRTGNVSWLGLIYGSNIAGAVLGCLLAGFYLLREFEVATATYVAFGVNAGVAMIAFALAGQRVAARSEAAPSTETGPRPTTVYVAIALSGLCALGSEAIWTRTLGLLLGSSVYTLSLIVAVFLVGLGLGSGAGSLLCRVIARPRIAVGACQLLAAAAIAWTAYNLSASLPYWPINPSLASDIRFTFELDLARALWALLPPTLLWGASFPLALAAGTKKQDSARLFAGIYAANTLGAIAGALGASLLLIAWVGSQHAQQVLIVLSIVAGLLMLLPALQRAVAGGAVVAAVLLAVLLISTVPPLSKLLVAHGRYAASWVGKGDIVYAGEGINSSVAVEKFPNGALTFHVAGKIQASNVARDMRLQRMLGHLTTLIPPNPRSVLVIGCGAGITAGAVSIDPRVQRETIAEIEPLVPQAASAYFGEPNFDVLRNPKVQVRIDDGRHYLLTTKVRFDGITVDPLDPWVKGAANLYTLEFLQEMKRHLNPGGVVTMYIQLFETTEPAVKSAVATFFEAFPNATIWGNPYQGQGHDMVLLGTVEPLHIDLDQMERLFGHGHDASFDRVADSLAEVGMDSPVALFATYAGRQSELTQWLRGAPINRDSNLRMQYLAGEGLNLDDAAAIYSGLLNYRRFPGDLFSSAEGRADSLSEMIRRQR